MQILGISFDGIEENAAFARKFEFNFPLLSDVDRTVGLAYGACKAADAAFAERMSFLIDGEGKIRKAYLDVDPANHPQEILKEL